MDALRQALTSTAKPNIHEKNSFALGENTVVASIMSCSKRKKCLLGRFIINTIDEIERSI